jgi:hypothetical protein
MHKSTCLWIPLFRRIVLVNEFDDGFSPGHSERSEESHNLSSRDPSPAMVGSGTARRGYARTPSIGLRPEEG